MIRELIGPFRKIVDDHGGEVSEEMVLAAAMEIPLFKEWREHDVMDAAERVHDLLESMVMKQIIDSPRIGVYKSKPPGDKHEAIN